MGGGTKQPAQEETIAEQQEAAHALARWNERQEDGYVDLEKQQVAESTRDYTKLFSARNSADTAVAERAAYDSVGRPDAEQYGDVANTISRAVAIGTSDAASQAMQVKDAKQLNVIKTGNDMASSTTDILAKRAGLANQRAADEVQNQILVNNSRTNAVMTAVGGAIQGNAMRKEGYGFSVKDGLTRSKSSIRGYNADKDADPFQDDEKLGYTPIISNFFGGR